MMPTLLPTVWGWELRRVLATRSTLLLAAGIAAFFVALVSFKHQWLLPLNDRSHVLMWLYGSSPLGQVYEVVAVVMTFFGLLVPFLAADGVAREHRQRTHELVMTTAVPAWSFVAGRFLAVLTQTAAAALLALAGVLGAELLVHAAQPDFPAPDVRSLLALWTVLVLPAGVLLAGASFLAGTLAPRRGMVVKIGVVLAWIALAAVVDLSSSLSWYPYWSPAGNALLGVADRTLVQTYVALAGGTAAVDPATALRAQQATLDLQPWLLPHLGLALIGLAGAAVAAVRFRRFRGLI
jgi:ABC-type transport system involved in multi-copper enzyme maturation permease subunit